MRRSVTKTGTVATVRIAWLTDIHLDHLDDEAVDALSQRVAEVSPGGVVLTGDISIAPRLGEHLERFAARFDAPVWFVAGNHDYWGASVAAVRPALSQMSRVAPRIRWLPSEGPVMLSDEIALVGVDGWADARLGDYQSSPVRMRDYTHIAELATGDIDTGVEAARAIADADARQLADLLERALAERPHVYVATHVPPFAESARYRGHVTTPDFLPWVTCKAVGDVLLEVAERHPNERITALCGHMHHSAHEQIRDNLVVRTGAAEYGAPALADVIEL